MRDPIQELVDALESGGKPSLAWVIRWSAGGRDPVDAAWGRSFTADAMIRLLELAGHPALAAARRIALAPVFWETTDSDRVRCDAIRRRVDVPPTLDELIANPRWRVRGVVEFVATVSDSRGLPS
jgi:hypothetical protein